jgi:hypothetical protein
MVHDLLQPSSLHLVYGVGGALLVRSKRTMRRIEPAPQWSSVRASMPMVWMFPLGVGAAYRSWEVVQSIPLGTMNTAPDLCCDKYRPACSDDCPLSLFPYTATIGICMSDY